MFGGEVSKSLSPAMHNEAFRHLGLPFCYEAISISPEDFLTRFEEAKHGGYLGLNITIPFKEKVVPLLDELSPRAEKLEAVNTVLFKEYRSHGENTDVDGSLEAMVQTGYAFDSKKSAFIFGAGGAARATIEALALLGIKQFVVSSRTLKRLHELLTWFAKHYSLDYNLEVVGSDEKTWKEQLEAPEIFVNAAPLEACQILPFLPEIKFRKKVLVVDWIYWPKTTPWLVKGEQAKGTLVKGYKILLYQGMKSFYRWTGLEAPEEVMEKALLKELE